jgi:hypothetical protein
MEQELVRYGKLLLSYFPRLDALFALALPLCLAGLSVLAVFGQGLARVSGRSAYDKCARQLARLGGVLGLVAILAGGVALGMQYQSLLALDTTNLAARENFLPLLAAGAWLCVAISALLNCLYAGLRQGRHHLLGFLAALAAAAAVYAVLLRSYARAAAPVASAPVDLYSLLLPGAEEFYWALGYAPFAALALAGGYGALWLMLRRVADDYGRDHYNLVIPWCANWACNGWLVLWLLVACRTGWRVFQLYEAAGGVLDWLHFLPDCVGLLALLPPGLWWMGLSRGTAPMRAKISVLLAPLWATGCLALLGMGLR